MILFFVLLCLPCLTIVLTRYGIDAQTRHSQERTAIVKQGCMFGLLVGACLMVLSLFGNVIPLPPALEAQC
jgi:hypothetical protein